MKDLQMDILNKEELCKQIRESKEILLDGILDVVKMPMDVYFNSLK